MTDGFDVVQVSYKVPLSAHLRKPLAVATAFLALFSFAFTAKRISLQIHKSKVV